LPSCPHREAVATLATVSLSFRESFFVMHVAQVMGRGAAVAFLLSVVSAAAGAAPIQMSGPRAVSRGQLASSAIDLADSCAQHVIGCGAVRFGELEPVPTPSLFATFAAQLRQATTAPLVTDADDGTADAWALSTGPMIGGLTQARLARIAASTADSAGDVTLLEDVSVLVQQVPEPSLLVSVALAIALTRASLSRRAGPAPR
jgi:hypothetical protein